ncbi:MAG: hypothetical protein AAFN78_02430 [Pseudomonadota bacterium]
MTFPFLRGQQRWSVLPLFAAALVGLGLASASAPSHAQDDAELTQEQRKMQAFAKRQYNRGRMSFARGDRKNARQHYQEAIKTYNKHFGETDGRLIAPLSAFVDSYDTITWEKPNKQLRTVLEQLIEVYEANGIGGRDRSLALAKLADWWVIAKKEKQSTAYYKQAWQAIADTEGVEAANRDFQNANTLYFMPPVYRAPDIGARESTTVVAFTITQAGRTDDFRILESNASGDLKSALTKALRRRYYRPPVADGEPMALPDVKLSFSFSAMGGYPAEEIITP